MTAAEDTKGFVLRSDEFRKWSQRLDTELGEFGERGRGGRLLGNVVHDAIFGGGKTLADLIVRTMAVRRLAKYTSAFSAANRLASKEAIRTLAHQLLEAGSECGHDSSLSPVDGYPVWIVPPFGVGTAHVTPYGVRVYDYEVAVCPLLFGRARITKGPCGRRSVDKAWEYESVVEAVAAFAVWQSSGFDGDPCAAQRTTGKLHDNSKPLCSRCMREVRTEVHAASEAIK